MNQTDYEPCTCGRLKLKPHCPHCGSYQTLAFRKKETVNRGGGRLEHLQAYRCRICGLIFNDDARQFCNALPPWIGRPPKPEKPLFQSWDEVPEELRRHVEETKKRKAEGT